ncbi:MAG: hypothetical protein ABI047_15610 [Jatrophihabitantaceae bacterium]
MPDGLLVHRQADLQYAERRRRDQHRAEQYREPAASGSPLAGRHRLGRVRQGLRSAQDLAKSATERFLAALVGIGAVIIANASKNLSDHVNRDLMLLVAGFLVALALFSVLVEGPLLAIPLRNLERDLKDGSSLLTADQLHRVTSIPSVGSTCRRLTVIRVVIPAVYTLTAVFILILGYPNRYK